MEYEGINIEVCASGINGGIAIKGSRTGSGASAATGAGAAFALFLALFFFSPPIIAAQQAIPPKQVQAIVQKHKRGAKFQIHIQIGNCEPQEPDAVEPELTADPDESLAQDPWL